MIEIAKNASEVFRIVREEYKGHDMLNVRVWWKNREGELCPSKKGIAIPIGKLEEVMEAIKKEAA